MEASHGSVCGGVACSFHNLGPNQPGGGKHWKTGAQLYQAGSPGKTSLEERHRPGMEGNREDSHRKEGTGQPWKRGSQLPQSSSPGLVRSYQVHLWKSRAQLPKPGSQGFLLIKGRSVRGKGAGSFTDLDTQGLSCPGEADCGREGLSTPRESSHERMGFSFTSLSPQELFSHEESCHCREDLSTSRVSRGRRVLHSFPSLDPCQSGPGKASWGRATSGSLVP